MPTTEQLKASARKLSKQNKLMKKALKSIANPLYYDSPPYAEYDEDHAKDCVLKQTATYAQSVLNKLSKIR